MFYKSEIEWNDFTEVKFLKPKNKLCLPSQNLANRDNNAEKKNKIIEALLMHMPPKKELLWKLLPAVTYVYVFT